MNLKELQIELDRIRAPRDSYSLNGGYPSEAFVIAEIDTGQWEVYYSERGQKTGRLLFENEHDACVYFRENYLPSILKYLR